MVIKNKTIEEIEYICLRSVYAAIKPNFNHYLNNRNQLTTNELVLHLSRQKTGRARDLGIPIQELVEKYLQNTLNKTEELELRLRIASSPLYKVGTERFVIHSIIEWLVKQNIKYKNYQSPNSADFAVIVNKKEFKKLKDNKEINNHNFSAELSDDLDGVIIFNDSKSIMGLKNSGDAITKGGKFGKFEAKWNQISYLPPMLREVQNSNHVYFNYKYNSLEPIIEFDSKKYLLVSIFVIDLICLPDYSFFKDSLNNLNGNYFNHFLSIVCVPSRKLQSRFYDSFFAAGKSRSQDKVKGYPRYPDDCRVQVMNNNNEELIFKDLKEENHRFLYLNEQGNYTLIRYKEGKIETINFFL
ncbi:MAG: hypothetical protein ACFE9L_19940 [Candidatus Hodarchaeota archaeon]